MRYYKVIENGYIMSVGTGGGGTEITEQEYNTVLAVIQQKPPRTTTTDYHLKEDLTWEEYPRIDPEPEPEIPENLTETSEYLLTNNMVELPTPEPEPDYLNEHEEEPNYFE